MLNNKVIVGDAPAAPSLTPDLLAKLKKEDMKQAIVERFSGEVRPPTSGARRRRSPYWQPADEEC